MRVLITTSVFPLSDADATPAFVRAQAIGLQQAGWQVRVIAPHGPRAAFAEAVEGVVVFRYPYAWPLRLQQLCYAGGMLVNLRKRPWTRLLLPSLLVSQFLWLLWQVLRFRPHVIHSHSLLPQGMVAAAIAAITSTPHVCTSHGNDVFGLRATGIMGALKRGVLSSADAVTVNSSATRSAVEELACPVAKIHDIPAMPNASVPQASIVDRVRSMVINGRSPCLLFVGRLIEEKGLSDLLQAMPAICKEFPDTCLLVVGDGHDRESFTAIAGQLNLASRVHWAGWIPPHQVASWMAAADVLVVPSRDSAGGWKEAQGLVVVEAMLARTLVVASRSGGIPDMIQHSSTGWLTPPGNPHDFAEVICTAIRDPRRLDLIANAHLLATERFSPQAVITGTNHVLRSAACRA